MKKKLLLLSILCVGQINAQVCFDPYVSYPVTGGAGAIITSDFNGDAILDLAVCNTNVSILLGNGVGGFGSATNFTVANGPTAICTADFNGDGVKDLAVACSSEVSIILGTGTGSFGTATNFTVAAQPNCIITEDFNNDGKYDLALTNNSTSTELSILLGNGTGSFGAPTSFITNPANPPGPVISADFNGDTIPDLVTVNHGGNNISILLGTGTGSFGTPTPFNIPAWWQGGLYSITSADFNGDAKKDLAVVSLDPVNSSAFNASVLLGTGTGSFGSPTNYLIGGPAADGLTNADFNGDGFTDLAFSYESFPQAVVMLGNGAGGFGTATSYTVTSSLWPNSIVAGDFNGDTKVDIAMGDVSDAKVLLNCGIMGLANKSTQQEILIYPNPTSDQFFIQTNTTDKLTVYRPEIG